MDLRPDKKKYRSLISTTIIGALAICFGIAGIVFIVLGITSNELILGINGIYSGFILIVLGASIFIICNIADDMHWQTYLTEYYAEETYNYHMESLKKLEAIETLLRNQQNPEDDLSGPYVFREPQHNTPSDGNDSPYRRPRRDPGTE